MTRNGKIARLPRDLREQLNRQLEDGVLGTQLVAWLNSLPAVQSVLAAEFGGRSVNEQNLSEWKAGGYREWQTQQEALEAIRRMSDEAEGLKEISTEALTDKLALWLAARYAVAAQTLDAEDWKKLREFCNDLVLLRRGDHSAEWLKLERAQLELNRQDKVDAGLKQMIEESSHNPLIRAAIERFEKEYRAAKEGVVK